MSTSGNRPPLDFDANAASFDEDDCSHFDEHGDRLDDEPATPFSVIDGGLEPTDLDKRLCAFDDNDLGNAERLEARNAGHIWWTTEWGPGVWDGQRFDFTHGESRAGILAQETARRMKTHEVPAFYATQRRRREEAKDWKARAGKFFNWAKRAGDNSRTESMLKQHRRMKTRALADFDPNPDVLVVQNGVLVLHRHGEIEFIEGGHMPSRMNTRVCAAKYDPEAKAAEFDKFLERVQPDPEARAFLARQIGYCLTGHIEEQAYFIYQGKGGDGKSTFLNAIEATLGGYVSNAAIESFLKHDKKGSDHSADIARLASGPRLVKAAEPEQGARFAEAMLKSMTGGEPITARAMYSPSFEFTPNWKLVISCNRKPQIRGDDRGIWRRTLVLPWPVSIPKEEMDKSLGAKLTAERDGILQWCLRGWEDWCERGLDAPKAVLEAVGEYRLHSNPFAVWFDECLESSPGNDTADRLYVSYCGFVHARGGTPMTQAAFGRALSDKNLEKARYGDGYRYRGVRLTAEGETAIVEERERQEDALYGSRNR